MVTKNLFSLAAVSAKCLCLVAALATACSLASCSDDDDDGGSDEGNPNAGLIETTAGTTLLLTSVGNIDFDYEDGKLVQIETSYFTITVSYYPFTITVTYDGDNGTMVFSNISVNGNGYITSANFSEEYSYEGKYDSYSETGSGSVKCSYDGNGHLTKMTCSASGSGKDVEDDETYSYSSSLSASATLSWSGDLLQNVSCSYNASGKEDGDSWEEEDAEEYDYENSTSYPNTTYQYTPNTTGGWCDLVIDYDIFYALAYLGYFGKGPSYHPVSVEIEGYWKEFEDGEETDDDEVDYSLSYSYSLNSDGSVYYSSVGSSKTYFTYSLYGVSDEDDDEVKTRASLKETSEEESPVRQRHGLFSRRHRRSAQAE